MKNNQRWVPWVAVIACAFGKYLSSVMLVVVMTICVLGLLVFFACHIKDNIPLIVMWVFGWIIISGIGGVVAVVFNLGSDMIVNAIFIPMFIYFVGLGMFSFRKCKSVSYKAWVGAFCIMLLLVINWSS